MSEIRIDPLTGQRTIIASDRAQRPDSWLTLEPPRRPDPAGDPFAEGNEAQTPPELGAERPETTAAESSGWRTRAFLNRYPVVEPDAGPAPPSANPDLFWAGP